MVKLTNTCAIFFLTLCCDSCCIYVFRLNVMGFVVCPCEHVSDFKCLCLLRAKIKGCFFFKEHYFIFFSVDRFIFICVAAVGHLIHAEADIFRIDWLPACTETCVRSVGAFRPSLSVTDVEVQTDSLHPRRMLTPPPRTISHFAFNIPHQAHSETSVCKRFAFNLICVL